MSQQQQFINDLLQDWAAEVERVLQAQIRKRGQHVPSETLANLRTVVIKAAAQDDVAGFQLIFQDSGRHVDMRQLSYRKKPISRDENFILNWVRRMGLNKFRAVPGYKKKGRIELSKEQQMGRIAAAIIHSKGRNLRKGRRRGRWFNKTFYGQVEQLIDDILDKQADYLQQQIVPPLREAFKAK